MFVLSKQLDHGNDPELPFRRCKEYLEQIRPHLPAAAYDLEWAGAPGLDARWLIEASDVRLQTFPLDDI